MSITIQRYREGIRYERKRVHKHQFAPASIATDTYQQLLPHRWQYRYDAQDAQFEPKYEANCRDEATYIDTDNRSEVSAILRTPHRWLGTYRCSPLASVAIQLRWRYLLFRRNIYHHLGIGAGEGVNVAL